MAPKRKTKDDYTKAFMDYYPLIFSAVSTKINNDDACKDVCQEVFMLLYEKLDTIEDIRKWLYGTMRFVVLRYFQKKQPDYNLVDDALLNDIGISYVNGFKDTRILISEAMEHISCDEQDHILLDLIGKHKFSITHVARLQGTTRRKVEYRYEQLIIKIIEYLKSKGINDIEDLL